ncbi:hypothetical protein PG988_005304 [Apiospora saccharicola]
MATLQAWLTVAELLLSCHPSSPASLAWSRAGPSQRPGVSPAVMLFRQSFPALEAQCLWYMYCGRCDADDAICDGDGNIQLTNPDCQGDCYCQKVCPSG